MPLKYDFDIHWIIPQDLFSDPKLGQMLESTGLGANARGNYVALFRDPDTVEALRGADQVVQDYLKACGFGLNTFDSGAGDGFYPLKDEHARMDVVSRLTENLSNYPIESAYKNGFEFAPFLNNIATAQPVDIAAPVVASQHLDIAQPAPEISPAVMRATRMSKQTRSGLSNGSKVIWGAVLLIGLSFIFIAGLKTIKPTAIGDIQNVRSAF